jgi:hypothetical protein
METFISWLQSLDNFAIFTLITVCILVFGLIPYNRELVKLWYVLSRNEKLEILYFNYGVLPINKAQHIVEQIENKLIIPEEIIEGSIIYLHWKVQGYLSLKLFPGNRLVTSQITKVNITRENRVFTLVARGLFKKKLAQIVIPLEKIKVIQTRKIHQNVSKVKYTKANMKCTNHDLEYITSRTGNKKFNFTLFQIPYLKKRYNDFTYPREQSLQWNRVIEYFVLKNVLTSFSIRPRLNNEQNKSNL